jgi:hypothetical protein
LNSIPAIGHFSARSRHFSPQPIKRDRCFDYRFAENIKRQTEPAERLNISFVDFQRPVDGSSYKLATVFNVLSRGCPACEKKYAASTI